MPVHRVSVGTSVLKGSLPNPIVTSNQRLSQALPLSQRIPLGTWDSHMHVVEPQRFPVATNAVYQPTAHTLDEALAFESSLGIKNVVLVQPSVYGTDNSCLLDALTTIGPSRGRGVVVIDPTKIPTDTLAYWHSLGVRGVRVNLQSVGRILSESELAETLLRHADAIRSFGWVIQLYLPLEMVPLLQRIVPQLGGVKICIDHFGSPDIPVPLCNVRRQTVFDPYGLPGFSSLMSLLCKGETYVKISAPYRLSRDEHFKDLEAMMGEFLRAAPHRVVYATDWPHTRFTGVDIKPFTELCLQLCSGDTGLVDRVFYRNAEEMMDG